MSQPTRLDEPPRSARATRLEQPARASTSALPDELAARLVVEQQFPTAGAEADVFLVRERSDESLRVLKLYRQGLKPKTEVLERVARAESRHLIHLYEFGQAGGLWYELLEYARYGSMRVLIETRQDVEATTALAMGVVRELSQALDHLHAQQIVHRDIKPENVLVRSLEPLDLVLTDFGISSVIEAAQKFTGVARTVRYSAPEAASGAIGTAVDWWSLGMMLVEVAAGRHPYEGLSEAVTMRQQMTRDVDVGSVADARLRRLCAGLLQRDPDRRWGSEQVIRWLKAEAGDDAMMGVAAAPDSGADATAWRNAHSVRSTRSYVFGGREFAALQPLATAMWSEWRAGLAEFTQGRLLAWVRDDLREQSVASLLIDWKELDTTAHYRARRGARGIEGFVDPSVASPEERFFAFLRASGAPVPSLADPPGDQLLTCAVHARRARRRDAESLAWLKTHLFAPKAPADSSESAGGVGAPATLAQYRQAIAARVRQAEDVFARLETGIGFHVQDQPALLPLIALSSLGHDTRPLTATDSRAEIESFSLRLKGRLAGLRVAAVPNWMREELWAQAKPLILNTVQDLRRRETGSLERDLLQPLRALESALARGDLEDGKGGLFDRIDRALPRPNPRPDSRPAQEVYALAASIKGLKRTLSRERSQVVVLGLLAAFCGSAMWGTWKIILFGYSENKTWMALVSGTVIMLLGALTWFGERRLRFRNATRTHVRMLAAALRNWIAELEQEIS